MATLTGANDAGYGIPESGYGRRARLGLLALLMVTVLFAAGVLFVKFQLEAFRGTLEEAIESRMGAHLSMGSVSVHGFRGLRVDRVGARIDAENGPALELSAPAAFVHVSLNDLLAGRIRVDRVVLDDARIQIERPPGADWHNIPALKFDEPLPLTPTEAFRITGKNGKVEMVNVVGDTRLRLDAFEFDVARLADSEDVIARLAGQVEGDPSRSLEVKLTYASLEDFDLRIEPHRITAEDVNILLPAEHRLIKSGLVRPTLWVNGRPDKTIMVTVQAPFADLAIRDQPEFLAPATGQLTAHAAYSTDSHLLEISAARAESGSMDGTLAGSISFAGKYPAFALELEATRLPITQVLDQFFDRRIEDYGMADFELNDPSELLLTLEGTSNDPVLMGRVMAGSGKFGFIPNGPNQPEVRLAMGPIEGTWDSEAESFSGKFTIADGSVFHQRSGVSADEIRGVLHFDDGMLTGSPITARISDDEFMGDLHYSFEEDAGELAFNGMLSNLETSPFHEPFVKAELSGSANLRGTVRKEGNRYLFNGELDATQTGIAFDWWLRKPQGLGANASIDAVYEPNQPITVHTIADVASSRIEATVEAEYRSSGERNWYMVAADATSEKFDVNAIGKCLRVPYRVTGGKGVAGQWSWRPHPGVEGGWKQTFNGTVNELSLLPFDDSATVPIVVQDATVEGWIQNGDERTGSLTVYAREADTPALGEPWFMPIETVLRDDEERPRLDRQWAFNLSVDDISVPPWQGTNFTGKAYTRPDAAGFESYGADIGEGRLDGSYHLRRNENAYTTNANWTKVPAKYLLEHLGYPDVLSGIVTGDVEYSLDSDDPSTIEGTGSFQVRDGRFSADFLYSLIERQMNGERPSLPPSLDFALLKSDVLFERDIVRTPRFSLDSEGIQVSGSGHYVRDGDMDYMIEVAVSPAMAEQMPVLMDNFSVEGYRLAQEDIELAFHIDGPTFGPRGQLAQLPPASVTLVSGALEMGSEAMKVIDIPRKILFDILKTGGGILAGPK